ncbi:S-layer homology domain-containing protein [Sporosarcina sp. YIM B06819]|uniref:S-layer homology domain-containing protein n=1 Tax=Sporosarcina sp. YIM B06819 TaxID=3081769 RepID=UPI00298C1221|nr:S-layer homology domain-containing protein [Sporosarcina sp. YIM B06819]
MTNNHSAKYKKFFVGAASAALVATAVAPVASAKDFNDTKGNTHETAIDALSDAGVITGYPDGSFLPNKTLTRSDVVKLMGKWLVAEGYKIPADYKTNMRFTDLTAKSNDELLQYAAVVKDNKVFNGSNGRLLAGDNITRENMAVVLVRAFDQVHDMDLVTYVKAQDFKKDVIDLGKAKAEARPAIDVLDFFNITNPAAPNFNPKNTTTRGQFATFLHKSMNTDYSAVKAPNADKVAVDAAAKQVVAGAVTVSRGEFATDANKLAAVQAYVTSLVTEKDVVATVVAGKTAGDYVVTLTKGEAKVEKTIAMTFDFAADDRFVTEVNALNATQVEVKFSVAVDVNDIAGKLTIQGVTFTKQSLSADGKVLTATASEQIDVVKATVNVDPIKTKADAKVKTDKYISMMTYKDVVAPVIASVESTTNGKIATSLTINVSEPIKGTGLVKVNGTYVTANFTGSDKTTMTVDGLSLETGKTHVVELINIEDLAGNKTVSTSANFTVNVDATVPAATLAAQGEKGILVTFNKSMDKASVIEALKNGAVKDEALNAVSTGTVTAVNDTQFLIPVTKTAIFADKASRTFTVVLSDAIKDKLGNKIAATTQNVTLTKDTVKPVATGYKVMKDNDGKVTAVEVNFSEGLAVTPLTLPTIVNENGVAVPNTGANAFLGGLTAKPVTVGATKVVYEAKKPAKVSGKFTFSFAKELVSDQAETANKSNAFNYTIDFGQVETETTFSVTSAEATNNAITVTFPEAVKGGAVANSATDLANYTLAGKPLAAGTTITLDATQKVATITLPAESVDKDDQAVIFTVANIQSTTGKALNTYTGTVTVADNMAPVLVGAKAIDNKTIELTYNEAVQLAVGNAGADFTIMQGTTAVILKDAAWEAKEVSGVPTKVRLTIVDNIVNGATVLDLTKEMTIETKVSTLITDKTSAKNTQKAGVKVAVTKP